MFEAKILADSYYQSQRITTMQVTFPRSILAEFNTHAMVRRNAASSRAIPVRTMMTKISAEPFEPEFRLNKKGMVAAEHLQATDAFHARELWHSSLKTQLEFAEQLNELNIHKQYTNRLLEPWMWATVIATATDWENLFAQRCHSDAEPSFQTVANKMYDAYHASSPEELLVGEWHLPMFNAISGHEEDLEQKESLRYEDIISRILEMSSNNELGADPQLLIANYSYQRFTNCFDQDVATGRCARVSYLTHTGKRDLRDDIILALKLSTNVPGHWTPFEHIATPAENSDMRWNLEQLTTVYEETFGGTVIVPKRGEKGYCGAYRGFKSYRHCFDNQYIEVFTR